MKRKSLLENEVRRIMKVGAKKKNLLEQRNNNQQTPTKEAIKKMFDYAKTVSGSYDQLDYQSLSQQIHDNYRNMIDVFGQLSNYQSLRELIRVYRQLFYQDLYDYLNDEFSFDSSWKQYVYTPLYKVRESVKRNVNNSTVETIILRKFPCLKDTPGYQFYKEDTQKNILYFTATNNQTKSYYGIKQDGTLYIFRNNKWEPFPQKTKCVGPQYTKINESILYEQGGIDLTPGVQPNANTQQTQQPNANTQQPNANTQQPNANTQQSNANTKQSSTQYMSGDKITQIQSLLLSKGYGNLLGTTGVNKNGVDGRMGPKTINAILSALTKELSTQPQSQISETIKNFKKLI